MQLVLRFLFVFLFKTQGKLQFMASISSHQLHDDFSPEDNVFYYKYCPIEILHALQQLLSVQTIPHTSQRGCKRDAKPFNILLAIFIYSFWA